MRETVHKIMSPNNKLIPYKDWTTTGQCLAIKSLLCGVSIGFSILICMTPTSISRTILLFFYYSTRGKSSSVSDRSARKIEKLLWKRREKTSNFKHVKVNWEMFPYLSCVTISMIIVLGPGRNPPSRNLDRFCCIFPQSTKLTSRVFPKALVSSFYFFYYNYYSIDILKPNASDICQ